MLKNMEKCFDKPIKAIYLAYSRQQPLYAKMRQDSQVPFTLIRGLPDDLNVTPGSILVIDDLMGQDSDKIAEIFTKDSHHKNYTVVYIVQSLFNKNPYHRVISLNSQYMILLSNPRDKSQILHLAKQVNPENPHFVVDAYRQATSRRYGYLVINFRIDCPEELRLRDNVLGGASVYYDLKRAETFQID